MLGIFYQTLLRDTNPVFFHSKINPVSACRSSCKLIFKFALVNYITRKDLMYPFL